MFTKKSKLLVLNLIPSVFVLQVCVKNKIHGSSLKMRQTRIEQEDVYN